MAGARRVRAEGGRALRRPQVRVVLCPARDAVIFQITGYMLDRIHEKKFWKRVEKTKGCWLWKGGIAPRGHGAFSVRDGHIVAAHRVLWEWTNGDLGKVPLVRSCSNAACVRPSHYFKKRERNRLVTSTEAECLKCLKVLPHAEFYFAESKGKLIMWCKGCLSVLRKEKVGYVAAYGRKRKYNLSEEDFLALLQRSGGNCEICGKPPKRELSVDHDHATGAVRGLLCRNHNIGLGFFQDDIALLEASILYLKKHGKK